jgi:hypothetical protein
MCTTLVYNTYVYNAYRVTHTGASTRQLFFCSHACSHLTDTHIDALRVTRTGASPRQLFVCSHACSHLTNTHIDALRVTHTGASIRQLFGWLTRKGSVWQVREIVHRSF